MSDTFKCAQCGGTFKKSWTDKEADDEALVLFGSDIIDPVLVCHECWLLLGFGVDA